MKRACIVFALCLALVLVCAAGLALPVYQTREEVEVTAATRSGDPAAAQGLTIHQRAHYNDHLLWEIDTPAHDPREAVTDLSYILGYSLYQEIHYPPVEGEVYVYLTSILNYATYTNLWGDTLEDMLREEKELIPLFRDVAGRTQAGERHVETLALADYMDCYPLNLSVSGDFVEKDYRFRMGELSEATTDRAVFQAAFRDFFAFPCDPAATWDFIVEKDQEGNLIELDAEEVGFLAEFYTLSAFTDTACYFAFGEETTLDLDFSRVPGGCGVYRIDLTQEDPFTYVEVDTLANACPLPEGAVVLDLTLSPDGTALFVAYGLGEDTTLLVLDPETGEVKQTFPVPAQPPEPIRVTTYNSHGTEVSWEDLGWDVAGSLCTEEFYLLYGSHTIHFFLRGEDGSYTRQLSSLNHGIVPKAAAWNGEKLALACPPNRGYFDTCVDLSVLDSRGQLLYLGRYENSLSDLASSRAETAFSNGEHPGAAMTAVRLLERGGLSLTWN